MAEKIYTTDEIKRIIEPIAHEYGIGLLVTVWFLCNMRNNIRKICWRWR